MPDSMTNANRALPTGTVTFLFTDIEGSTKLWEQHPNMMRVALARHDAIMRQAIESHNGTVVKTTGDGVHAAFATAPDALKACIAAQRALHVGGNPRVDPMGEHTMGEHTGSPLPIRVRMGLHTGAAEQRDGDYYGTAVNQAARIMSVAHGGQIVLSLVTAELVRGSGAVPKDVTLRDLGEHRLKGLLNPEHLWQVVAPDLPQDFPPLASLNTIPNNLPAQLTSFIGREKAIAEVTRLLTDTDLAGVKRANLRGLPTRLVTLTGVGGTGKTRLSLQVATEVLDSFKAGVWFVELAPLADPNLVPQSIAAVLGVREETGRPLISTLSDYLREKKALLILDNCEHLLQACAALADGLLRAAPRLHILASSREALGIAGETTWPVPSLEIPNPKSQIPNHELMQYEAVRLFVERAGAAQPKFALTPTNAAVVAQICQRLDGIPLALELAAARVKTLTVEQLATRLNDRFRLLTGGSRTALLRQQTLRAAIDWSYNLLSEEERGLLRRLSVFAGGWTLEAAEQVTGDGEQRVGDRGQGTGDGSQSSPVLRQADVLDLLTHLVDKSLVVVEYRDDGEARYGMLETIRQYAREKLLDAGEMEFMRSRHLTFFLNFAEAVEPKLGSVDEARWYNVLATDHDNFLTAIEWSLEHDEGSASLRLVGALGYFWFTRGYYREGMECLTAALSQPSAAERTTARVKALIAAAQIAWYQVDYVTARQLADEGLAIATELHDSWHMAVSLCHLGVAAMGLQNYLEARSFLEQALALLRKLERLADYPLVLLSLGSVARVEGDNETALRYYEELITLDTGNSAVPRNMGHIALHQGDTQKARSLYRDSLTGNQKIADKAGVIRCIAALAGLAATEGHTWHATRLLGAVEALLAATHATMLFEQDRYEGNIALVRAQLSAADFDAAWAAGQKLTMEEAVKLALEESG